LINQLDADSFTKAANRQLGSLPEQGRDLVWQTDLLPTKCPMFSVHQLIAHVVVGGFERPRKYGLETALWPMESPCW
jgi:hypothetical protein